MMYNKFLEKIILPTGDFVAGTNFAIELKKWRKIVRYDKKKIKEIQKVNLQNQLTYCKRKIPFYKKLNLPDIEDPYEMIKYFPVMNKKAIRENLDDLVIGDLSKLIKESSSGSSGIQGTVYMTKAEESVNRAIQVLWWEWAGYKIGDKIIQTGMTHKRNYEKQIKDILFQTDYYIAFGLDKNKIQAALEKQRSNPRKMLLGYASSLYLFAKVANELNYKDIHFESVVSWGDKMFEHYRNLIESQFSTKVFDTYACTEGFMISAQCENGNYHIMSPQIYLEILDADNNEVKAGEFGNVVVTRLDSRAMPLVRYSLGDLAVKESEDKTCSCGRGLPLLRNIVGRDTDIVKTTTGKYMIVHFFTAIFEHIPEIEQFRVIQKNLDEIEIEYVKAKNFNLQLLDKIKNKIYDHLGESINIDFKEVSRIPASQSGKPQIILSLLNKSPQVPVPVFENKKPEVSKKSNSLFELTLKMKGFPIQEAVDELQRIGEFSEDEFRKWQSEKRWETVKHHFEHNDFYKNTIGDALPTKWNELPILSKSDYQNSKDSTISRDVKHGDLYTGYTSGSSGHPFRYAKDKFSHAMTWALIKDRYGSLGLTLDSKQARFYGIPLEKLDYMKEKTKDFLSNRIRFPVFDLSDDVMETFLEKFKTTKFEYVYGYTNSMVLFARYLIRKKVILKNVCPTLRVCIGTSENFAEEDKKIIREGFGVSSVNEYGTSEVDLIAMEGINGEWKISEENIYIEILDDDGNQVTEGGEGRIILTALHNKVMPFIRYEIGDRAIVKPSIDKVIIQSLIGGLNDIIILPSGRKSPGITFYFITRSILENIGSLKEFIIKQVELNKFVFEIVSDEEISDRDKNTLQKKMDAYLEPGLIFEIKRVEKIERTKAGKMKHFHSFLK
ncbi:MAG: hypothetical protein ABI528_00460 [bacterium]